MTPRRHAAPRAGAALGLVVALVVLPGCGGHGATGDGEPVCVPHPCPLPTALTIDVAAAGGPVAGVFVDVTGAVTGSAQCYVSGAVTSCSVPGTAGTYNLRIGAPGFETVVRTVTVPGTTPWCECATVVTQHVELMLVPASGHGRARPDPARQLAFPEPAVLPATQLSSCRLGIT
jgi:hypothetical protein